MRLLRRATRWTMDWGRELLDTVVPPVCPLCRHQLTTAADSLCADCLAQLPMLPERRCPKCGGPNAGFAEICRDCLEADGRPWEGAVTAFPYSGNVCEAVRVYKYHRRTSLATFFASRMRTAWQKHGPTERVDMIVPVPLHWRRYLHRGYNQAALLAEELSPALHVPMRQVLRRIRSTRQQAKQGLAQRQRNMRDAFACIHPKLCDGARILLVDDVLTTGATLGAATEVLLQAGAANVFVLTIARD